MPKRHMAKGRSRAEEVEPRRGNLLYSIALLAAGCAIGIAVAPLGRASDSRATNAVATPEVPSHAQQLADAEQLGISVPTVVSHAPGKGLGVLYAGSGPLPARSVASLYRCLVVRADVLREWRADGTLLPGVWEFWLRYSMDVSGDEQGKHTWRDQWQALPVGDLTRLDEPGWWRHGSLSDAAVSRAIEAMNAQRLVDWRRPAHSPTLGHLFFNAHLINEPSGAEAVNVEPILGAGCGEEVKWCGSVVQARTVKTVQPGGQLLWCYGDTYAREYGVGLACRGGANQ